MSGVEFVEALRRIGYPGVDRLDGHNFDWLFDCESVVPFLTWFCKEVQPSNVVDKKDLDEYHELEAGHAKNGASGLLSGSELEEALQRWSLIDDSFSSDSTITDTELGKLREELTVRRQRRDELKSLHDKLAIHHTAIADRVTHIDAILTSAQSEYQLSAQQMNLDNANMNKSLEAVIASVSDLLALYKSISTSHQPHSTDNSVLLSHSSLENYHTAEEKFTQQLVAYTKKQFFDGIGGIAGQSMGSDYELIDVSNPDLLLVKGSSEDVVLEARKELTHLKLLYPVSEAKRLDALLEECSTTAACEFQEREIRNFKDTPYPSDQPSLSARLKDAQTSFASLNRDMLQLTDVRVPSLIKDVASLQSVKVLRGDYDLKIARQDYFTSNQDQVIDQLVLQRSRNEFLTMALELESRSHRDVHKLLTAITQLLQKIHVSFGDRMKMMLELEKAAARTSRTTVDSRDKFLNSIHQLIGDDKLEDDHRKTKGLFVTYSQIEQNADRLSHQMAALQASLSTTSRTEHDRLLALDQELAKCDAVLYADCSTTGGQPSLSPRPVVETMTQLDSLLKKLEQVVMDVIKDIDNKKKVLQKDPLLKTERELFGYFFNDPSRLRHSVHDVEARVQAHS